MLIASFHEKLDDSWSRVEVSELQPVNHLPVPLWKQTHISEMGFKHAHAGLQRTTIRVGGNINTLKQDSSGSIAEWTIDNTGVTSYVTQVCQTAKSVSWLEIKDELWGGNNSQISIAGTEYECASLAIQQVTA